jgi:hypothetical protein
MSLYSRQRETGSQEWTADNVVPLHAHRRPVFERQPSRHDDETPPVSAGPRRTTLLHEEELRAIESAYPGGLTAVQVVDAFTSRNIKFSEASFRKYVQQGLLPRSKRIGRKGKYKGSLGLYPAKTVRRINAVKQLMRDGYTIEQIQEQFLLYTDLIEGVAEHVAELLTRFERDVTKLDPVVEAGVLQQLADVRRDADRVVEELGELSRLIAAPHTDNLRLTGAAGGAEDLL